MRQKLNNLALNTDLNPLLPQKKLFLMFQQQIIN